jgi:hypothetical protein
MVRPFLSLWPIWLLAFELALPFALCFWFARPSEEIIPVAMLASGAVLLLVFRGRTYWRLCGEIGRFRTVCSQHVTLHYAPTLDGHWDFTVLLQRCKAELDDLTRSFGFRLRRRVVVFLFAACRDIARIRPRAGGLALPPINAILIGDDGNLREAMRHELGHLFSSRWNLQAPPFLREGLSVWLEGTRMGQPIDVAARPLVANRNLTLARLLNRKFFFSEPHIHACYVLAGSFTAFLIRRYGWERYRRFYRRCVSPRFRAQFVRCFGVSLEKAEWQWRTELQVMEVLKRRRRSILGL